MPIAKQLFFSIPPQKLSPVFMPDGEDRLKTSTKKRLKKWNNVPDATQNTFLLPFLQVFVLPIQNLSISAKNGLNLFGHSKFVQCILIYGPSVNISYLRLASSRKICNLQKYALIAILRISFPIAEKNQQAIMQQSHAFVKLVRKVSYT